MSLHQHAPNPTQIGRHHIGPDRPSKSCLASLGPNAGPAMLLHRPLMQNSTCACRRRFCRNSSADSRTCSSLFLYPFPGRITSNSLERSTSKFGTDQYPRSKLMEERFGNSAVYLSTIGTVISTSDSVHMISHPPIIFTTILFIREFAPTWNLLLQA